jgi:cytochrome c nitrite reductase small subunit
MLLTRVGTTAGIKIGRFVVIATPPFIPKYFVKAQSGYHHVTAFIFGNIPGAIRAQEGSKEIVQENCERCHAETVATMLENPMPLDRYCFECHRSVAHGERGVSLLPYQHKEND